MSQYEQFLQKQNLQKKKETQQRLADAQSLHKFNQAVVSASLYKNTEDSDADVGPNSYDAAKAKEAERARLGLLKKQMEEQEAKWKEDYNRLMEENDELKKQGEFAQKEQEWQERYEEALKEKDEAMARMREEQQMLMEKQQLEAARLKEREERSTQLLLRAASAAQREKERYEAALKEKDDAMLELQKGASTQSQDALEMDQEGPSCPDDLIQEEEEGLVSDRGSENSNLDKVHCADDNLNSECTDEEEGITKEDQSAKSTVVKPIDGKAVYTQEQQKNRRCYIIIGLLFCLIIVAIVVAVPIAVTTGTKNNESKQNRFVPQTKSICGRPIPIDLTETSTWPTPSTPTLFQADYEMDDIALVTNDEAYGSIGVQLNAFFRAFDLSHDTRLPLYITQDSWIFESGFFKLFLGGFKRDQNLWTFLEELLGTKIVPNEAVLAREGKFPREVRGPEALNGYVGDELVKNQIRNHRDTIMRKLFQYPTITGGPDDVCSLIQGEGPSKKYTGKSLIVLLLNFCFGHALTIRFAPLSVVHLSDEKTNSLLSTLNESTGLDHSDATEMSPEYVKSFLSPLKMLKSDIYPIATGEYDTMDTSVSQRVQALINDYVLGDLIKLPKQNRHLGSVLYFAVMAGKCLLSLTMHCSDILSEYFDLISSCQLFVDVYIGNPVDHNSMWIARMRCALGMASKTFILTKSALIDYKKQWVSYLNEENYLELYDREKLGLWSG